MVLAGGAHQFAEPVLVQCGVDWNAMGADGGALCHQVREIVFSGLGYSCLESIGEPTKLIGPFDFQYCAIGRRHLCASR